MWHVWKFAVAKNTRVTTIKKIICEYSDITQTFATISGRLTRTHTRETLPPRAPICLFNIRHMAGEYPLTHYM